MMISNPRTRLASIESEERRSMVLTDRFKFRANQTIQNARKKEAERLLMEKENWIRGTTRNPRGESRYTCKRNNNNTGSWRYRGRRGGGKGESQLGISRIKSRVVSLAVRGPRLLAGGEAFPCIVTRYTRPVPLTYCLSPRGPLLSCAQPRPRSRWKDNKWHVVPWIE